MDEKQRLFRLLTELVEAVRECPEALERARRYADSCKIEHRKPIPTLNPAWIGNVRALLPYVEKALDEQRRFMRAHRDVVRVDRAKRVTSETVRHLAQHSEFITRIDRQGNVQPDRLMTVEREENYAIYENRFLYTLVLQLDRFLSKTEQEYRAIASSRAFTCGASKRGKTESVVVESRYDRLPDKSREVCPPDEWEAMRKQVAQMLCSPLMRLLNGTTPVRYPVVRTNLIKKNVNFQKALELFEFMLRQPDELLTVADGDASDGGTPELSEAMGAIASLVRETAMLGADKAAWDEAKQKLEDENDRMRIAKLEEEQRREAEVLRRIQAARDEEIAIKRAEIAQREAEIESLRLKLSQSESRESALEAQLDKQQKSCRQSILRIEKELECLAIGLRAADEGEEER